MYPSERDWVSTVVCHLFVVPVRSDQRCAAKLSAWWAAKRWPISNDRHRVISVWILTNKPSLFSSLQGLCNGVFVIKIGHKLTSNKAPKVGLVTVVSLGVVSGEVSANFERPSRSHLTRGPHASTRSEPVQCSNFEVHVKTRSLALERSIAAWSSDWWMTMGKWKLCVRWSACGGSPSSISLACFKQEE